MLIETLCFLEVFLIVDKNGFLSHKFLRFLGNLHFILKIDITFTFYSIIQPCFFNWKKYCILLDKNDIQEYKPYLSHGVICILTPCLCIIEVCVYPQIANNVKRAQWKKHKYHIHGSFLSFCKEMVTILNSFLV